MRKRADQVEATRQRIIEAAVRLHTTVGPANTTITALAEEAGVTRLTVYRHFPDETPLFTACLEHWYDEHPAPDLAAWHAIGDVEKRFHHGLRDLYAWYGDTGQDLLPIYRDAEALPPAARATMQSQSDDFVDALTAGAGARGNARQRLRAAAGHAVSYWTWHSLVVEQSLESEDAAYLAASLLFVATGR
jgi:AcrR family transcriptional regulator